MLKKVFKLILFFIFGTAGGIFADQILWPYFIEKPLFYQYRLDETPIYITEKKEVIIRENTALEEAIDRVEKAVVGLKSQTKSGSILEGSGLILTNDGLIISLAELVPQGATTSLYLAGKKTNFQILKRDLQENLVLIKAEDSGLNFNTIGFADLSQLKLGERVFLVGILPSQNQSEIVNEGIVKNFTAEAIKTNIFEKSVLKGSPLFNIAGEFLGINNIDSEGKITAIPLSKIKSFAGF